MKKDGLWIVAVFLLVVAVPSLSRAEPPNTEATGSSNTYSLDKEDWLQQVQEVVPKPICKGFLQDTSIAERFKEVGLTFETCVQEIRPITDQCINDFRPTIPEKITQSNAPDWGRKIGECIGTKFAEKYLSPNQATAPSEN